MNRGSHTLFDKVYLFIVHIIFMEKKNVGERLATLITSEARPPRVRKIYAWYQLPAGSETRILVELHTQLSATTHQYKFI